MHTESEHSFIGYTGSTTNHVPSMAFGELVVADVKALHVLLLELCKYIGNLLLSLRRLELEGDDSVRHIRVVVSI